MKKILTMAMLGVVSISCGFGQGEVNFANAAAGINSPVRDVSGVLLSGSGYAADLFYGTTTGNNDLSLSQLTDAGLAQAFFSGGGAGYFLHSPVVTLPVSGNTEFIVVVWQTAAGATWAAATGGGAGDLGTYMANGGSEWGASPAFTFTPNVLPYPASNLVGLTPFSLLSPFQLVAAPEPTTLALGGLGAAALLLFRRRK